MSKLRPSAQDATLVLAALREAGAPLSASELTARLNKSQPTLSRVLRGLGTEVVSLGRSRSTRYAPPSPILGLPARQALHWVQEDGRITPWGEITWLANQLLHVQADGIDWIGSEWPWFLSPLRAQGFLGRLLAAQLANVGVDANPERWSLEQGLYAASRLHDAPGALMLGLLQPLAAAPAVLAHPGDADAMAADVAATLPAGSSAGGEQAKFLARLPGGESVLVKFSPPRGTPFGERWHDLLVAEHTALRLLASHEVPTATARLWHTDQRTYLLSTRFDRVGAAGRRHVVALDAWHQAFVPGGRQHWAATCIELARQKRVDASLPLQAAALLHFGRLIGNTDMHFGNLSLYVQPEEVAVGRGRLAPVYDMLPMRWRPEPQTGSLTLTPFEPASFDLQSSALPLAQAYWALLSKDGRLSGGFRRLAAEMLNRLMA